VSEPNAGRGFRVDIGGDDGKFQPLGTGETFTLSGTWDDVEPEIKPIETVKLFPKAVRLGRIHLYPGHYEMTAPEMRRDGACSFAFMVQRSQWVPASRLRRSEARAMSDEPDDHGRKWHVDPKEVLHYDCPVVVGRAVEGEGVYIHPHMTRLDGDLYDSLGRTLRYQCPECKTITYVTFTVICVEDK
jgi:hypothetical protein